MKIPEFKSFYENAKEKAINAIRKSDNLEVILEVILERYSVDYRDIKLFI
jgi:hypothetical protein